VQKWKAEIKTRTASSAERSAEEKQGEPEGEKGREIWVSGRERMEKRDIYKTWHAKLRKKRINSDLTTPRGIGLGFKGDGRVEKKKKKKGWMKSRLTKLKCSKGASNTHPPRQTPPTPTTKTPQTPTPTTDDQEKVFSEGESSLSHALIQTRITSPRRLTLGQRKKTNWFGRSADG